MLADMLTDCAACYRLTRLLQRDSITEPLREWLRPRLPGQLVELLECPWCLSVWVGAGVVAGRRAAPRLWKPLATALALSAVTGLVMSQVDRPE